MNTAITSRRRRIWLAWVITLAVVVLTGACSVAGSPDGETTPTAGDWVSTPGSSQADVVSTTVAQTSPQTSATSTIPNLDLIRVLAPAETMPGVEGGGWEISHGAPYEFYTYGRDGAQIGLLVAYQGNGDLGQGMFGEGVTPPPPEVTTFAGYILLTYPGTGTRPAVVHLEGLCETFDLWAGGLGVDLAVLAEDLVTIAQTVSC